MTSEPTPISETLIEVLGQLKQRSKEYGMGLTDQEVIDARNHVEFMRRPHLWRTGDLLPLKRHREGDLPQVAVLTLDHESTPSGAIPTFVVHENMSVMGISFGEEVTIHRYVTPEDVAIAGWEVD